VQFVVYVTEELGYRPLVALPDAIEESGDLTDARHGETRERVSSRCILRLLGTAYEPKAA
jgi:hypothetical protein